MLSRLIFSCVFLAVSHAANATHASNVTNAILELEAKALADSLGLIRRIDVRFEEFLSGDKPGDGLAQRRRWRSVERCPYELLITDNYGQIAFEMGTASGRGTAISRPLECSWRVRPGFYLEDSYFRDMAGPVTIDFLELTLGPDESLEIWAPEEVTSTANVNQLAAFDAELVAAASAATALTAETVAPGTEATEALSLISTYTEELAQAARDLAEATTGWEIDRRYGTRKRQEGELGSVFDGADAQDNANGNGDGDGGDGVLDGSAADIAAGNSNRTNTANSTNGASAADETPLVPMHMIARYEGGKHPGADPPPPVTPIEARNSSLLALSPSVAERTVMSVC